jgi:hypothetical protein
MIIQLRQNDQIVLPHLKLLNLRPIVTLVSINGTYMQLLVMIIEQRTKLWLPRWIL